MEKDDILYLLRKKYDEVFPFSEGLSRVKRNEKWGYVNEHMEEVISLRFDIANDFKNGIAIVNYNDALSGLLALSIMDRKDASDEIKNTAMRVALYGKWLVINTEGQSITKRAYDSIEEFADGRALVGIGDEFNRKFGYIDTNGNEIISVQYDFAKSFNNGIALVRSDDISKGIDFFIDINGNKISNDIVIELKYKDYHPEDIINISEEISGMIAYRRKMLHDEKDVTMKECLWDILKFKKQNRELKAHTEWVENHPEEFYKNLADDYKRVEKNSCIGVIIIVIIISVIIIALV
ncbi:MAG: WG repeat-containing protein [Prevotellaceae bacterium]|nr:WG repeat-containing protein [Prevotellaceae bacterium]